MLTLKNLTVKVQEKIILRNINFTFEKGKIYALMGPNGSGKSTLAYAIMGHPQYQLEKGKIEIGGKDISNLTADERAKLGLFLSFQTPLSLTGVNVFQLLRLALSGKKEPLVIKKEIETYARQLKISSELIERWLNEGASGGEKKKLEVLQAAVLSPTFLIFDEVDTGVDVDALKVIATFINRHKDDKTYLFITHYNRILKYVKPDSVLVMIDGKLVKTGDYKLAYQIEKKGYEKLCL
ncbi:MAG: Fe-S cluster assembly ATPase SufC [Microgenomates group bacterium]